MTPWLCLYHWDLPQALQDQGGWPHRDTAEKFADYARVVARRLADRVKHWVMFNEPNVHALFGHGNGSHAPGLTGMANLRGGDPPSEPGAGPRAAGELRAEHAGLHLGTVINVQPTRPSSPTDQDRRAAARFDAYWNGTFLDPLFKGAYPPAIADEFAPLIADRDLQTIKQPIDFLGLNYYAPMYIADGPQNLLGAWYGAVPAGTRFTAFDWPIDAAGLTEALIRLRDQYGNPEVYITENGACFNDLVAADGTAHDDDRIAYLR